MNFYRCIRRSLLLGIGFVLGGDADYEIRGISPELDEAAGKNLCLVTWLVNFYRCIRRSLLLGIGFVLGGDADYKIRCKSAGFGKLASNRAFTLAEVLITLGIIGIVAAMTLPAISESAKKKEAEARIKKFVSVINQTLMYAENEHGPRADWAISSEMNTSEGAEAFLKTYIQPYVKNHGIKKRVLAGHNMATIRFFDGSQMSIKIGACYDIYFDVNGEKKPNEIGVDIFPFILCKNKGVCNHPSNNVRPMWCMPPGVPYPTHEEMITNCKNEGTQCTMLLEENQYEFPKDYPKKL